MNFNFGLGGNIGGGISGDANAQAGTEQNTNLNVNFGMPSVDVNIGADAQVNNNVNAEANLNSNAQVEGGLGAETNFNMETNLNNQNQVDLNMNTGVNIDQAAGNNNYGIDMNYDFNPNLNAQVNTNYQMGANIEQPQPTTQNINANTDFALGTNFEQPKEQNVNIAVTNNANADFAVGGNIEQPIELNTKINNVNANFEVNPSLDNNYANYNANFNTNLNANVGGSYTGVGGSYTGVTMNNQVALSNEVQPVQPQVDGTLKENLDFQNNNQYQVDVNNQEQPAINNQYQVGLGNQYQSDLNNQYQAGVDTQHQPAINSQYQVGVDNQYKPAIDYNFDFQAQAEVNTQVPVNQVQYGAGAGVGVGLGAGAGVGAGVDYSVQPSQGQINTNMQQPIQGQIDVNVQQPVQGQFDVNVQQPQIDNRLDVQVNVQDTNIQAQPVVDQVGLTFEADLSKMKIPKANVEFKVESRESEAHVSNQIRADLTVPKAEHDEKIEIPQVQAQVNIETNPLKVEIEDNFEAIRLDSEGKDPLVDAKLKAFGNVNVEANAKLNDPSAKAEHNTQPRVTTNAAKIEVNRKAGCEFPKMELGKIPEGKAKSPKFTLGIVAPPLYEEEPNTDDQLSDSLRSHSVLIKCLSCGNVHTTETSHKYNVLSMILGVGCFPVWLAYMGWKRKDLNCYNADHYCQKCQKYIDTYTAC